MKSVELLNNVQWTKRRKRSIRVSSTAETTTRAMERNSFLDRRISTKPIKPFIWPLNPIISVKLVVPKMPTLLSYFQRTTLTWLLTFTKLVHPTPKLAKAVNKSYSPSRPTTPLVTAKTNTLPCHSPHTDTPNNLTTSIKVSILVIKQQTTFRGIRRNLNMKHTHPRPSRSIFETVLPWMPEKNCN